MEFCPSGEFFDLISKSGKLDEEETKDYFVQLIRGIEHAHSLNIAHRDLKPENILIDSEKRLKLADFGLSATLSDGCPLVTSCGSANYAAPEIV